MALFSESFSKYLITNSFIDKNGVEQLGLFKKFSFLEPENLGQNDTIRFTVPFRYAGRPDLISNHIYGTPFLEWVIVHFKTNQPLNTIGWPKFNQIISVPSPTIVFSQL